MALALRRADGAGGLAVAIAMAAILIHWLLPPVNAFFSEPWGGRS